MTTIGEPIDSDGAWPGGFWEMAYRGSRIRLEHVDVPPVHVAWEDGPDEPRRRARRVPPMGEELMEDQIDEAIRIVRSHGIRLP